MSNTVKVIKEVKGMQDEGRSIGKEILFNVKEPFTTVTGLNPFYIVWNNKTPYELKKIHFYNEDGVQFTENSGWFSTWGNNPYMGMGFSDEVKKKMKPKYDGNVFIISKGRDWSSQMTAELYIPMEYLEALGYTIEEDTRVDTKRARTTVTRRLKTKHFSIYISSEDHEDFEKQKCMYIEAIEKCKTRKELEEVQSEFYWMTN